MGDQKLIDARINKLIDSIKILSEMIEKDWDYVTKRISR